MASAIEARLAKATGQSLLYVGNDFPQTDLHLTLSG